MTDDGEAVEFMSDGTVHMVGDSSMHPATYEIMKEGYIKFGEYDGGWLTYRYTYWDVEIKGNRMTWTKRDNPDRQISFTKE